MASHVPQRVLVTGADGVIGRAVVADLIASGIAVTALSLRFDVDTPADRCVIGNASDEDVVMQALEDVDAVVHLAAIPHPDQGTAREVFVGNVAATFTVLSRAAAAGVTRAVIASSVHASGIPLNHAAYMPAYFPLDENLPSAIDDPYSLSKSVDEQTLRMMASRWGMSGVAFRFPLTAGEETLQWAAERDEADPSLRVREGWAHLTLPDCGAVIRAALTADYVGAHVLCVASGTTLLTRPTQELLAEYAPTVPVRAAIEGHAPAVDTTAMRKLLGDIDALARRSAL